MRFFLLLFFLLGGGCATLLAQTAQPTMTYVDEDGKERTETAFSGSAPFVATFSAHTEDEKGYAPRFEWRFYKGNERTPFLLRYDEQTTYQFSESGSFRVQLFISFIQGTDTVEYVQEAPFTIAISESQLDFPNAFTPNGDGVNDIFRAKAGYKSITSFRAMIFSRSGRKIFEWDDLSQGWDGTHGGSPVPDGGYYLHVQATGADGRGYHLRKVITLLRKNLTQ